MRWFCVDYFQFLFLCFISWNFIYCGKIVFACFVKSPFSTDVFFVLSFVHLAKFVPCDFKSIHVSHEQNQTVCPFKRTPTCKRPKKTARLKYQKALLFLGVAGPIGVSYPATSTYVKSVLFLQKIRLTGRNET